MKSFKKLHPALIGFLCLFALVACKKDKNVTGNNAKDVLTANEYVYNLATKKLTPTADISGNIKSEAGIKLIYSYLVRSAKTDSLVHVTYATAENKSNLDFTIPVSVFSKTNMTNSTAIKNVIKHIDNSSEEVLIKLTSFQPPLPKLENFPASKLPDANDKIAVTGKALSETGLDKIEILDDSKGAYTIVTTISNLNGAKTYDLNYSYTYRAGTANLKVIAYDTFGIKTEVIIKVPALPYTLYKDVTMSAQGNSTTTTTNNHFFISTGKTAGSCTLNADEFTMDFLFYGTSSGPSFYSPTNATNIAKNFYCNGTNDFWNTNTTDFTKLKPTRFRVLVPGDAGVNELYTKFAANDIADLDDTGFFAGVSTPSSSTARYSASGTPSSSQFNITTTYLIWARVPTTPAATSYKNCLIRVKEAVDASTSSLSTVKFDIYVPK